MVLQVSAHHLPRMLLISQNATQLHMPEAIYSVVHIRASVCHDKQLKAVIMTGHMESCVGDPVFFILMHANAKLATLAGTA